MFEACAEMLMDETMEKNVVHKWLLQLNSQFQAYVLVSLCSLPVVVL